MCIRDRTTAMALLRLGVCQRNLGKDKEAGAAFEQVLAKYPCLLYTSDAADERSSVDLGGRRIIKKNTTHNTHNTHTT